MKGQGDSMERPSMDPTGTTGLPTPSGNLSSSWDVEDQFWRESYNARPYAEGYRYERFRPAYRYGFESARHHMGRTWEDAEADLRSGWDRYEHRGDEPGTWESIRDAVKDAWHRVTGSASATGPAERIGDAFHEARDRHPR
jgi:hypothetical protein